MPRTAVCSGGRYDNLAGLYTKQTLPGVGASLGLDRLLAGLEQAEPAARTDFAKPLKHFQEFLRRRGIVLVISDFYEQPETIVKAIEPLRFHGSEVVLFHVLDPKEIFPEMKGPEKSAARGDSGLREAPVPREDGPAPGGDAGEDAGGGDGISPAGDA